MVKKIVSLVFVICFLFSNDVYASCVEPENPYCLDSILIPGSGWNVESCKREIEQYADDWKVYLKCKTNEADGEVSSALKRFNCIVDGEKSCFDIR